MVLKDLIYYPLRQYVKIILYIYFKEIKVIGSENIPKKGPLLFLANHQNAFLDALLLVTHNNRKTHFVARAEVFKKPFYKFLMSLINMMPIYRIRDGWQSLKKNDEIFKKCHEILAGQECLLVFPEGNHSQERRLRPLSKGFSRIAFGTLEKYPDLDLKIIPMGINYENHSAFSNKMRLVYGEAIDVKSFYSNNLEHQDSLKLRDKVFNSMRPLISHIDQGNYQATFDKLLTQNPDFSNPEETQQLINQIESGKNLENNQISEKGFKPFKYLFKANSFIALYLWGLINRSAKDKVMIVSIKFAIGVFLFPVVYALQSIPVYVFFGYWGLTMYFLLTLSFALLYDKKI